MPHGRLLIDSYQRIAIVNCIQWSKGYHIILDTDFIIMFYIVLPIVCEKPTVYKMPCPYINRLDILVHMCNKIGLEQTD